jgi:hypothetical protein
VAVMWPCSCTMVVVSTTDATTMGVVLMLMLVGSGQQEVGGRQWVAGSRWQAVGSRKWAAGDGVSNVFREKKTYLQTWGHCPQAHHQWCCCCHCWLCCCFKWLQWTLPPLLVFVLVSNGQQATGNRQQVMVVVAIAIHVCGTVSVMFS